MLRRLTAGALCAAALIAAPSQAAVIGTLTFNTPTGTVFSNENIDVYVTLHLDAMSDAVITDALRNVTSGLSNQDIIDASPDPLNPFDPALVTHSNVNNYYSCSGTFTGAPSGACDPGAYQFTFNTTDGPQTFFNAPNLDLQPGTDHIFLFGTFSPVGGNAAPGTYTFYNLGFFFQFQQTNPNYDSTDPTSPPVLFGQTPAFAQSCSNSDASCAFTRDVLSAPGVVPEPGTWALMILGFGGAGAMLRRRRTALA